MDVIGVRNANILGKLHPLCISSSLAGWMEGGSDQIAGIKRFNADGIPDQTSPAGELEEGDTVRSLTIFLRQTSRLQN